jgi:two-component system CheB/CheR fusion protein
MSESEVVATGAPRFPVVGLGASAGGLEALSSLLARVPSPSGIAFVAVTHQHAGHLSHLPEILARGTKLEVNAAVDGTHIQVDHLYVCPPGGRLGLLDGVLQVVATDVTSADLPIDAFFRALADDMKERAVAVVLSGTGSDGTVGARLVKAAGGLVLAQEPSSAEHDGMPASVITSGAVDDVLRPEDMATRLIAHAGLLARGAGHEPVTPRISGDALQQVLVRERTGRDLSSYKQNTVVRRTERRMNVRQIADPSAYVRYLQDHPEELDQLFKDVLISVTAFFRDPDVWQRLQDGALGALLRSSVEDETFRAWVPGCATGEEAYTIAIAVREVCEREGIAVPLQVFATDLDDAAVEAARAGMFPAGIAADVGPERLARWFRPERAGYRISPEIRDRVAFASHDVLHDPPFTRLHLLSCRNLLIYLQPRLQQRLMPLFHYALRPSGILVLGTSETVGQVSELFEPIDQRARIFRRRDGSPAARGITELRPSVARRPDPIGARAAAASAADGRDLATLVAQELAARYVPASIVVDADGEVIHVHGRMGPFLELATGGPTCNAFLMARPGLQLILTSAVQEALARDARVAHRGVEVRGDEIRRVDVVAEPLVTAHAPSRLVLVSFEPCREATESATDELRIGELEREVARTSEHLRRVNEELQRTNEELQSSNEELQSSNEELMTSKEELQSLNEELHTLNDELQAKVTALARVNDDMANLLESTSIATVFLDRSLRIKRYTQPLTELIHVIDTDVGRPIGHLASELDHDQLPQDAESVLRTLVVKERQLRARSGRHYLMRILPYRTTENVIDGVVVTFIDTTELHAAQVLAESRRLALSIVDTVREPLLVLEPDLRVVAANRAFYRTFQLDAGAVVGRALHEVGTGEWDIPELRRRLAEVVSRAAPVEDVQVTAEFARIGRKRLLLNARPLRQEPDQPELVLLAMDAVEP